MMLQLPTRRVVNRCVVCAAPGDFPYDARFDGPACDGCHALLTIKDDIFRRQHPEFDAEIRAIWRDLHDPAKVRDVGRRYAEMGYFDEEPEEAVPVGPDDRVRREVVELVEDED